MRLRPYASLACLAALLVTLGGSPAAAAGSGGPYDAGGSVLNILPPGSRGNVSLTDAAAVGPSRTATATTPKNYADQLEMYDALNKTSPGQLGEGDLIKYFKDAPIDLPADQAVSVEKPRDGVTISRDTFGVPFIVGTTAEDVAYGAGYAGTQDRMFLTDLLRHVGGSRLAEFLGPSEGNIAMDRDQLLVAPYTREEAEKQVASVVRRYPVEGAALLKRFDAFLAGINAAQRLLCPGAFGLPVGDATGGEAQVGVGFGPNCPAEYAALGNAPTDFTRGDITYIASLVGGIFGKGGGGETANALWLRQLTNKFGAVEAKKVFEDLRERNDPEAPTAAQASFPYNGATIDPSAPGAVLPDLDGPTASGTGADAGSTNLPVPIPALPALPGASGLPGAAGVAPAQQRADYGVLDGPFGKIDLGLRKTGMSNALLVDAAHSTSGHPTVVFGPQTGYFTPQLLTEVSLRGPGIAARGVSFAGTQLIVELGHGVDYAWSATSASSDIVDTVAETLCNADGSKATVESTSYLVDGTCTPLTSYVHTETALPSAAGMAPPAIIKLQVLRSRHGIVTARVTADGKPVALATDRSTFTDELSSVIGFSRVNNPDFVTDAASFQRAFAGVDYVFNWFYVDDRDISYFGSGLLPIRAAGHNPDLPRSGDRAYDWQGFEPFERHARQTNPPQGYLVSWNNKQAPGFSAADNQWGYGPIYRSLLLEDRIKAVLAKGKMTRVALVDAMQDAAHTDLRGEDLLPLLLEVVGDDPAQADAIALLKKWIADGTERVDRDRDGSYTDQAAIALFDQWWEGEDTDGKPTGAAVAKDVLRGTLGDLVDKLPQKIDDHPRIGLGSAWNGVAWYGYVSKDLRQVLGKPVTGAYSRTYCGAGSLEACRTQLRASLAAAVQRAIAEQGVASVKALTYDKSEDFIRPTTGGLVGTRPLDWQNRPTFQQVVAFSSNRRDAPAASPAPSIAPTQEATAAPTQGPGTGPGTEPSSRPTAGPGSAPGTEEAAGGRLPRTGGSPLLPLAAFLLLGSAVLGRRTAHRRAQLR